MNRRSFDCGIKFCFKFCLVVEDPGAPKPVGPIMTPAIGSALEVC